MDFCISWRSSTGPAARFWRGYCRTPWTRIYCIDAIDEALARYGKPTIFNSGTRSQFTSEAFTTRLIAAGVEISMDGRGRFLDNIFIERWWRSFKYEEIHLKAYADG